MENENVHLNAVQNQLTLKVNAHNGKWYPVWRIDLNVLINFQLLLIPKVVCFSVFGHSNLKIPMMETTGTCETMGKKMQTYSCLIHERNITSIHVGKNSQNEEPDDLPTLQTFVLLPNLNPSFSSLKNLSQRFSKAQLTFAAYVMETWLLSASFHIKSGGKALWCEQLAAVPEADGNSVQMGVRLQRAGPSRRRACFHFCARLSSGWPSHLRRSIKRFPAKSQERKPPAFQNKRSAGVKCSTTWTVDGLRPHLPHVNASHSTFYLQHRAIEATDWTSFNLFCVLNAKFTS